MIPMAYKNYIRQQIVTNAMQHFHFVFQEARFNCTEKVHREVVYDKLRRRNSNQKNRKTEISKHTELKSCGEKKLFCVLGEGNKSKIHVFTN